MDIQEVLDKATGGIHVERVYGTPIERDGVLVIPAASVQGGGGGGGGTGVGPGGEGEGSGSGGGFGLRARPVGAFVVRDGDVRWVPVIDYARLATAAAMVAVVGLIVRRSVARARIHARARAHH